MITWIYIRKLNKYVISSPERRLVANIVVSDKNIIQKREKLLSLL